MPSRKEPAQDDVDRSKSLKVEVSTKVAAVAQAKCERKRTMTEVVPPDLTRAKVGR
jgi:hypothetical protein